MKTLIHFSAFFICYVSLGVILSCSDATADSLATSDIKASEMKETRAERLAREEEPPMIMQQFHGCKAHR